MPRYYNTVNKNEELVSDETKLPPNVIALPGDNLFWKPIPKGKQITYDAQGIPNGYEQTLAVVLTPIQLAVNNLYAQNINANSITSAMYLNMVQNNNVPLDAIEAKIAAAAETYKVNYEDLVNAVCLTAAKQSS